MRIPIAFAALLLSGSALLAAHYTSFPLHFEANQGQAPASVQYLARGSGYAVFLGSTGAGVRLQGGIDLRIQLEGARHDAPLAGADPLPGTSHYFTGSDPSGWHRDVPNFARVRAHDVYPGIDVVYYGTGGQLEYDFVVSPSADPRTIRLAFEGATPRIDSKGSLILHTERGEVQLTAPAVYQEVNGRRKIIRSAYLMRGKTAGFRIAAYDRSRPLIIDPSLVYSSYLGAGGFDGSTAIAADSNGNTYITGWTSSVSLTVTPGAAQSSSGGMTDAFLAKIDPTGTVRLYTTYFGGSMDDYGRAVGVDQSGNIYVAGSTDSSNFPTLNPIHTFAGGTDAFVAKFSASGALAFSTLLGGSGLDQANAMAIDNSGVYIAGSTTSPNFPTTPGAFRTSALAQDAFVVKLNLTGTAKIYSTCLGGSAADEAKGVAVNASGEVWVVGGTWSTDFPVLSPRQIFGGSLEAFVSKLNSSGSGVLFSTFLGGSSTDQATAVGLDPAGNAYVTGNTTSANFPTTAGALRTTPAGIFADENGFVTKYSGADAQVVYSTYLGGSASDKGLGIAADDQGNAIVTGQTSSNNFPVFSNVRDFAGSADAFGAVLNPDGNGLLFSSWIGGSGNEAGMSVAILPHGRMYLAGLTNSTNFPIRPATGALQPNPAGGLEDGFFAALTYCDYTATLNGNPFTSAAGGGTITLTTSASSCGWFLTPGASWLTITSPLTGAGNATVTFTLSENTAANARSTSLTIAGQTVTVTQNGSAHPAFFAGEVFVGNGIYYLSHPGGNLFGYYGFLSKDWLYHMDLGYLCAIAGSGTGIYFWDLATGHWFYTAAGTFPYLYDFTLNTWIYYFPDSHTPGHYTSNPRWFANMTTSQIFSM